MSRVPELGQRPGNDAALFGRCLRDNEEKLLELQQFLIELRGPRQATTSKAKMNEFRHSLVYPFREGKLESLRHSLRDLLHNLHSAVASSSLQLQSLTIFTN